MYLLSKVMSYFNSKNSVKLRLETDKKSHTEMELMRKKSFLWPFFSVSLVKRTLFIKNFIVKFLSIAFLICLTSTLEAAEIESIQIVHSATDFARSLDAAKFVIDTDGLSLSAFSEKESFVSPVIRNDFAFNAIGAHWLAEFPAGAYFEVFVRTSIDGVNWRDWLFIPPDEEPVAELAEDGRPNPFAGDVAGALAFVHSESRFVQYRLDFLSSNRGAPVVKRMSLQLINSTAGPDIDRILREKSGRAETAQKRSGRVPKPVLIKRAEWGAQPPRYAYTYTTVGHIAFHHTAGVSDYDVVTKDDCAARVRAIQDYHRNTLGWNDIGYNYAICKLGHIFQGREDDDDNSDIQGAHDAFNACSMGVANLGYFHEPYNHQPTPQMLDALYRLLAWKCDERGIDPYGSSLYVAFGDVVDHIYGHQEVRPTACPGDLLFALKPVIKDSVAQIIAGITTPVADEVPGSPADFQILHAFPNPVFLQSDKAATIRIMLKKPTVIKLAVFNVLGQSIREIHDGRASVGRLDFRWDLKDEQGKFAPPGIYFFHLSTPEFRERRKMIILR